MDMTWKHLILLSLSKKRPKNIFQAQVVPATLVIEHVQVHWHVHWQDWAMSMAPGAFYLSLFLDTLYII